MNTILIKAYGRKDIGKLVPRIIVDKNGKKMKVWVKPVDALRVGHNPLDAKSRDKLPYKKYDVVYTLYDKNTGKHDSSSSMDESAQRINIRKDDRFAGVSSLSDLKRVFEDSWNHENPTSRYGISIKEIVPVEKEKPQVKASYSEIWKAGKAISGGFGFWGSYELKASKYKKELVRAWVDALRSKGYSDEDIVGYGDWTDGRHIADEIDPKTTDYSEFKRIVSKNARDVAEVHNENKNYGDKIKNALSGAALETI